MRAVNKVIALTLFTIFLCWSLAGCSNQGPPGPTGPSGLSVTKASVKSDGHLIVTLSNGQTLDAGSVVGPQGPAGGSFADVISEVEPSIVRIDVTVTNGLDSGSGTIVDKRGYIITNNHVINGATGIKVTIKDGTVFSATVVGADSNLDLAVIKLDTTRTDFPVITLGRTSEILVGDRVMAAGFPAGTLLSGPATFTSGVVSAMRTYNGTDYIQTDTPINPGNSGGCLFTMSGKMIGVPEANITPPTQDFEDINLAIPIDKVNTFIAQYVK